MFPLLHICKEMFILSYVVTAAASSHLIITLSKHASLRNPFNKPLENFDNNFDNYHTCYLWKEVRQGPNSLRYRGWKVLEVGVEQDKCKGCKWSNKTIEK